MTTAMQIGETARDRADFCRCFKTGAAIFLHDDGVVAHSTHRNTLREAYMLARTNCDTRGCKPFGIRIRWPCPTRRHVGDNRPKRRRREAFLMQPGIANGIPREQSTGADRTAHTFSLP